MYTDSWLKLSVDEFGPRLSKNASMTAIIATHESDKLMELRY